MSEIPRQLASHDYLIKLKPETKEPVGNTTDGPFFTGTDREIRDWVESGGNVGFVFKGEIIGIDIDSDRFRKIVENHLPATFSVRSGGGGEHRYYQCSDWDENRQFKDGDTDLGSIRADDWQAAIPPSIHDETGDRYQVLDDRSITPVPRSAIEGVVKAVEPANTAAAAATGGGGAARVGGSELPEIPDEYPAREATWSEAKGWLQSNGLLDKLTKKHSSDWSGDEFVVAKSLAEAGFSPDLIRSVLDRFQHKAKWHRRGDDYQTRTVRNAITATVKEIEDPDTPDPAWHRDTAYKPATGSQEGERRKTESGGGSAGSQGGDSMSADYSDLEEVTILEGSEDGDSLKKVVLVEREENGESVEYVALKKGRVEEAKTTDGESVLVERITDSTSLGSPDYIGELATALEKLDERLNGQ